MQGHSIDLNTSANVPTELAYLSDTYRMNGTATALGIQQREDGFYDLVLDRTIFYPKGGGQPSDTGRIVFAHGEFEVRSVALSPTGIVSHTCALMSGSFPAPGDTVDLLVNAPDRMLNARNHTAGHLIDLAVQLLPYSRPAVKANHAGGESWIQFNGDHLPPGESVDDVKRALTTQVESLVHANLQVRQLTPSPEEIASLGVTAPAGKSVRVIAFEGYESLARGCGGTHVRTAAEVGKVVIAGVRARKGILSVTYQTEM